MICLVTSSNAKINRTASYDGMNYVIIILIKHLFKITSKNNKHQHKGYYVTSMLAVRQTQGHVYFIHLAK